MPRKRQHRFNTTQLDTQRASRRQTLHRDVLAHHLRWTHIAKFWKGDKRVLDIGCGIDAPLCWALYSNGVKPKEYVGVDFRESVIKYNKENLKVSFPTTFLAVDSVNNPELILNNPKLFSFDKKGKFQKYDIVTCFEVIEHVPKEDGIKLLKNLSTFITPNGKLFLSTPCYDGKHKAANHIYEWRYIELKEELEKYFNIEAVFGTFASQIDLVDYLTPRETELFEKLKDYYESNMLSVLFAPLYPAQSRNCIWRLSRKE